MQRESVLQGRIVDASGREADLMRKLGEMAGTISTAQVLAVLTIGDKHTLSHTRSCCLPPSPSQSERNAATKQAQDAQTELVVLRKRLQKLEEEVQKLTHHLWSAL